MTDGRDTSEIGVDPLDSTMGRLPPAHGTRRSWWLRNRLALGLSLTPGPALLLIVGLALGPQGLDLLSRGVVSYLDPAVSAALAALGVLIGLGLDVRRVGEWRLLGAATLEAGLTILLVGAGVVLVAAAHISPAGPTWLLALILGVCASASSTAPGADFASRDSLATRIGDLDDVLPIILGGLILATLRAPSPGAAAWLTVQCVGLAATVACAAWLLVTQSSSDSDERVFTVGTVLLLGGIAEFLSMSALLVGLVAGTFWSSVGGRAPQRIARDVGHMQHPLVVLLLVVAGSGAELQSGIAALVPVYVVFRLTGKIVAGWLVRRVVSSGLPADFSLSLIPPGVIAVAFGLNVGHAGADPSGRILATVVVGSILSEAISLIVRPRAGS